MQSETNIEEVVEKEKELEKLNMVKTYSAISTTKENEVRLKMEGEASIRISNSNEKNVNESKIDKNEDKNEEEVKEVKVEKEEEMDIEKNKKKDVN